MGDLAIVSGFFSFVIGLTLLIVFLVMTSNIGSILRTLKRIESNSVGIKSSLERISKSVAPIEITKKSPDQMTTEEKARAYDKGTK